MFQLLLCLAPALDPAPSFHAALAPTAVVRRVAAPSAGPAGLCIRLALPEGAPSLPFSSGADPFEVDPSYDRRQLVPDVMAILAASDDPLVHGETLRRAVVYVGGFSGGKQRASEAERRALAEALHAALEFAILEERGAIERGERSPDDRRAALLALDLGVFQGSLHQNGVRIGRDTLDHLERAVALQPDDRSIRFVAALGGFDALGRGDFEEWLGRALELDRRADGLVERNSLALAGRLWNIGTVDALERKLGVAQS